MSTPEEQSPSPSQSQSPPPAQPPEDPYGTQTWSSHTWDTSYQPVHPPLGAVPGQAAPPAPEAWFRDEVAQQQPVQQPVQQSGWPQAGTPWPQPQGDAVAAAETAYLPPVPAQQQPQQQPVAPDGWFRDEAPQPQQPVHQQQQPAWPQAAAPWPQQGDPSAAAETAYLPPVRDDAAAEQTAYLPPVPAQEQHRQGMAPDGWFRDEAPQPASAAAETAYLPPVRDVPAEQTAYLPPVRDVPAEQTAYLPPVRDVPAEQTAYLPPVRDIPAEQTAYLPPVRDEAPAADPAAYSPPTLGGNTVRAVDPAQARAEGRSPIIDPGPQSAILTAALGLLMAVAAFFGQYALLLPLIALQGLTAAGWFRLNGMWPARQGIALAFAGALVADAAVLAVDRTYGPGAIIGTLGAWVLLTLVLQLRSHADPDERMYGLMASVASAALAIICAGFLAADSEAVTVGAVAVAVAVFTRALPLPTPVSVAVSLAAAAGAGIAVGGMTGVGVGGALLGLAAGVCALIGLRVAAYDYPSKFVHMTAGVALPLAVAAPAVYLIGRVVG
ncbi:hypothetical protein [Streptomyces sp. RerS4]|uniref:hypothetical protein n=1 Tax=Streptomyces sp. RerS4 TaxID=2942449 RepID=UPI00201BE824|nr:hypothetical protein [Streptomyces sp. RerS4]UQX02213.1 hypothetical protein M4D82_18270 [Streptomyces sp. RerS4]